MRDDSSPRRVRDSDSHLVGFFVQSLRAGCLAAGGHVLGCLPTLDLLASSVSHVPCASDIARVKAFLRCNAADSVTHAGPPFLSRNLARASCTISRVGRYPGPVNSPTVGFGGAFEKVPQACCQRSDSCGPVRTVCPSDSDDIELGVRPVNPRQVSALVPGPNFSHVASKRPSHRFLNIPACRERFPSFRSR